MLKIIKYKSRSDVSAAFFDLKKNNQTWLVSDLRTKFELQRVLLEKDGFYVDDAILRASDLWRIFLKRISPGMRDVSESFIRSLVKSFLNKHQEILGVNSSSEETILSYANLLASVHLHPEGEARLNEWFSDNPESALRWQEWALRSRVLIKYLVDQEKVISSKWITSYLQRFNDYENFWNQDLIVDLGAEISRTEAEIFRVLSRHVNVTILQPEPDWASEFKYLLQPYADLSAQAQNIQDLKSVQTNNAKTIFVPRFSGMLAEVKHAVSACRSWLDQGVSPEKISISAPDIEQYWAVLQSFLEIEGIPFQKDISIKLQSLPAIVQWMADLRSRSGSLSSGDLQIAFYNSDESNQIRYEEFKALFKTLYVDSDLSRNEWVEKKFLSEKIRTDDVLSRDQFVQICLYRWNGEDAEPLQVILRELLKNASDRISLSWSEWLSYLENIASQKETVVKKGDNKGVLVTRLMSVYSQKSECRIFLGLSEEATKKKNKTKLASEDYYRLGQDIGFFLENPDQSDLEFELYSLMDTSSNEDHFCFGATDFSGSILSPSNFWIDMKSVQGEMEHLEKVFEPGITRWDEIQHSVLPENPRIDSDLGKNEPAAVVLNKLPRISASAIEDFLKCPFVFAAKKHFRLQDLPEIDLDIDHRTRGQLAHAIFEKLGIEPMRFDWSDAELSDLLETIKVEKKIILADAKLWLPLKNKHLLIAKRFLQFEQEWRKQYSDTKIQSREQRFEFYFDCQTAQFQKEQPAAENYFKISGQIDRIDRNSQNQLVVLDYKSSSASAYSISTGLRDGHIQLLMYMWAIEKELVGDIKGQVLGLFYYVFRSFDRSKGFSLDEFAGAMYPAPKRKRAKNDQATKDLYLDEFEKKFLETLTSIKNGVIEPKPMKMDDCKKCEWRGLCRAKHLM